MSTTQKQETPYGVKDFTRDEEIFKNEIQPRINKLLKTNKWEANDFKEMKRKWDYQNKLINELKEHCRNAKAMTGRIIKFPKADSFAMYIVTKVWKTKCTLQWIDYMDGWTDNRIGYKGSIDIEYIHNEILGEDNLDKLFS
jgi:hypothetical protein